MFFLVISVNNLKVAALNSSSKHNIMVFSNQYQFLSLSSLAVKPVSCNQDEMLWKNFSSLASEIVHIWISLDRERFNFKFVSGAFYIFSSSSLLQLFA